MYGITNVPECSLAPQRVWVLVEFFYYLFNMGFVYSYYLWVKKNDRDNFKFLIFNCFLNLVHSGWLLYGNIIYYKFGAKCYE